jgi:hypothetical protein
MTPAEFEALVEPLRQKSATAQTTYGLALIEGLTATADQIASVEQEMAVILPEKYKAFMMRYGGGAFGFVELFPIATGSQAYDDLKTLNDQEFPDRSFVAVAAVGTGDHWGFPVTDGHCQDSIWFHSHDAGDDEPVAADFLAFIAEQGLKSSTDRALERRDQ